MTDDLATGPANGADIPPESTPAAEPEALPVATPSAEMAEEVPVADPAVSSSRRLLFLVTPVLVLGSLFGFIAASGIWEPPELRIADLSRRIAVVLFGATSLVVESGNNGIPTTSELGRGELPFTSIAVGMRLFGLSEWAGRLPMATWGLLGVLATVLLLARLADRVTAAFGALVLATMPLYFLQARTMLGDIVTMASLAIAVAGLGVATLDARPSAIARAGYWILGAAGMAAGFSVRGALLGVAIPGLAVGLSHRVRRKGTDRLGDAFGGASLLIGGVAAVIGIRAMVTVEPHQFSRWIGGAMETRRGTLTHDAIVLQLGHSLFPWSAVVPFALASLLKAPPGVTGEPADREASLRVLLGTAAILAFGVYTAIVPSLGALPYGAVFALAGTVAITFRDVERGAPLSRAALLGVASFLVLFYSDFKNFPDKVLAGFVSDDAKLPESFKKVADLILKVGTVATAGALALLLHERDEGQPAFRRDDYRAWPRVFRTAYDGNVWIAAAAIELSLVGLAVALFLSEKGVKLALVAGLGGPLREGLRYAFLLFPLILLAPTAALLCRDACRVVLRRLSVTRGLAALGAVAAFGAAMSFVLYPSLARQISPKESFDAFRRLSRPGEELGMLGGSASGGARYYAKRDVRSFSTSQEAFVWLTAEPGRRRWLVVRAADVGQLNASYRGHQQPSRNLPVLDARSSEILLASNLLRPGEVNENPLSKWVLEARPNPSRKLDVDFNGQLQAIGWDVTTPDGAPVFEVRAGKPFVLRLYYEVIRPISGEWQTFIHIDGYQRRYNGDHDTLEGKYPFHLWRVGDFIVDVHPFELEPNFTAGAYTVFFGLFRGDQRLAVKRGGGDDNRVNAGTLQVR